MEWEKPDFVEISLAWEISSYANAELEDWPARTERVTGSATA